MRLQKHKQHRGPLAGRACQFSVVPIGFSILSKARLLQTHAKYGASVIRVFAHRHDDRNGIMPSLGNYNEQALKR